MVESPINLVGVQRELLDQIPIMRHTFPETGGGGVKNGTRHRGGR